MTRRDRETADLFFEVPRPAAPVPGSMDFRAVVTSLVGQMLGDAARNGKDRWAVAADVSRLAGKEVSKYMLDQYSAPSRDDYNIPAWLMPLLETACDSHAFSAWLAEVRGARLSIGRDAVAAELGRIARERDELKQRETALRDQLRRTP